MLVYTSRRDEERSGSGTQCFPLAPFAHISHQCSAHVDVCVHDFAEALSAKCHAVWKNNQLEASGGGGFCWEPRRLIKSPYTSRR